MVLLLYTGNTAHKQFIPQTLSTSQNILKTSAETEPNYSSMDRNGHFVVIRKFEKYLSSFSIIQKTENAMKFSNIFLYATKKCHTYLKFKSMVESHAEVSTNELARPERYCSRTVDQRRMIAFVLLFHW